MTLREFKEVFTSKPCSYHVCVYALVEKKRYSKKYFVLEDFYNDDFLDHMNLRSFQIHDGSMNQVFIILEKV